MTNEQTVAEPNLSDILGDFKIQTVGEAMDIATKAMATHEVLTAEEKGKQIPVVTGYRLLCMVPKVEDKYTNGLYKAVETMEIEGALAVVLFVVAVGPDAYKDEKKFPNGPYCKAGDFILVRPHAGTKLDIHGTQWRILNDDCVEAVVDDPRGIKRA